MKKRGQVWLLYLFLSILLIGATLVFLMLYVNDIKGGTILEERYFSRDLALTVNAIYASPGSLFFNYRPLSIRTDLVGDENDYLDFFFMEHQIGSGGETYPYAADLFFNDLTGRFGSAEQLGFTNDNFEMEVDFKTNEMGKKWKYPQVKTEDELWTGRKTIAIGPEGNDLAEHLYSGKAFVTLKAQAEPDIYLRIEGGTETKAVIAYKTAARSRKLAALILNKILENNPETETLIEVSGSQELASAKEAGIILFLERDLIKSQDFEDVFGEYYGTE